MMSDGFRLAASTRNSDSVSTITAWLQSATPSGLEDSRSKLMGHVAGLGSRAQGWRSRVSGVRGLRPEHLAADIRAWVVLGVCMSHIILPVLLPEDCRNFRRTRQ